MYKAHRILRHTEEKYKLLNNIESILDGNK